MLNNTGKDNLLVEALEAFKIANYNGIALLPTGSGKGKLMIEIAQLLKVKKILYLCNTELLRDVMFKQELLKWNAANLLPKITMLCYQSAYKLENQHYDLLLADEFDAALSLEYSKVFFNNTFTYKICVSATLDATKRAASKKIAPVVFERKPKETQGTVTNKVKFYFINYNLTIAENNEYLGFNNRFKELLVQPETTATKQRLNWLKLQRKHWLSGLKTSLQVTKWLVNKLATTGEKVLIFCGLSTQANAISTKHAFHSENNNLKAFTDFDAGAENLLVVIDKISRGLNINQVRNIIFETTGSSKTAITQKIGRGLRLAVDEEVNVFFLIPWFKTKFGLRKPTIVKEWIINSLEDFDISKAQNLQYEEVVSK